MLVELVCRGGEACRAGEEGSRGVGGRKGGWRGVDDV